MRKRDAAWMPVVLVRLGGARSDVATNACGPKGRIEANEAGGTGGCMAYGTDVHGRRGREKCERKIVKGPKGGEVKNSLIDLFDRDVGGTKPRREGKGFRGMTTQLYRKYDNTAI